MEFNQSFTKHFQKTNAIIKTAEMRADGWNTKIFDEKLMTSPQSFGYVWDQETNFLWMLSAERDKFAEESLSISTMSAEIKTAYQDGLSELIRVASEGSKEYGDWEVMLSHALVGYTGTTRTWDMANRMRNGGNFIVCRYSNKKNGMASIRPLYIASENNAPLNPKAILDLLADVSKIDKRNHPEWFE